jgi:methyltransferase (TIGR00027 family)
MNEIKNVSDTALWVAYHRALESRRPNAVIHDPFAEVLAGDEGKRIARALPYSGVMTWIMAVRTSALDRLIRAAIERGCDTVVNLGAGLDTRPYRMDLPAELRWIEIDMAPIIDLKKERLANERPVCRLERFAVDLSVAGPRRELFRRIGEESRVGLILTEGVLPYLSREEVAALVEDLNAVASFQYWAVDYFTGDYHRRIPKRLLKKLKAAPFRFNEPDWFDFFEARGWKAVQSVSCGEEGRRIGRPIPSSFPWSLLFRLMPAKQRAEMLENRGYALLQRAP